MRKPIFALIALAFSLFGTQCWAQSLCGGEEQPPCSITRSFDQATTEGVYDFGVDGRLVVDFKTVLRPFTLIVTPNHLIDQIDFSVFPTGTVCVPYAFNGNQCTEYDFTGNAGGPNGVPVKNQDYKGMITLTLTYDFFGTVLSPAFGHAPETNDTTMYSEDILTSYSEPIIDDPTMGGTLPGLSSVVALNKPLTSTDTACPLTLTPTNNPSGQKAEIEVTFKIVSNGSSCASGTGLRDKTASLSVSTGSGSNFSFQALKNVEANKFHWDSKNGLNEYDFSTDGLVSGQTYTVTVISSMVSPKRASFVAP